ncbi:type II secretion system F family protein [Actinomadura sp. 3N407]|uniref:type II secretion system F family protein n=1 Tax=Actinomadura sp. 3N407 TaxID=3457423 RepID=UPI003FCD1884
MSPLVFLGGALAGLGVFMIVQEFRPAPLRLEAALDQLDSTEPAMRQRPTGAAEAVGHWLTQHVARPAGLPMPHRDLSLLGQAPERFMFNKLCCLLLGLALPSLPTMAAMAGGMSVPFVIPAGAALLTGPALFFAPDAAVRVDAGKRRAEFRRALTSFLDFVALERAAGAHPNQALESAATVSDSWVFRRIRAVLDRARRAQEPPWQGLADLGEEVAVDELTDIAETAQLAGNEGARILDTLMAKAESMRHQDLAEARSSANANTTTMVIPVALLGLGFLLLLAFPVLYRMAAV